MSETQTPPTLEELQKIEDMHLDSIQHAQKRMDKAASTMERMDHKDALYSDLGSLAMTDLLPHERRTSASEINDGEHVVQESKKGVVARRDEVDNTATGKRAMPRTILERIVDRRLDKRAQRRAYKQTERFGVEVVFGSKGSEPSRAGLKGVFGDKDIIPGKGSLEKVTDKGKVHLSTRRGELTARESREERARIDAQRPKRGAKHLTKAARQARMEEQKTKLRTKQPVSSRWRNMRRERAIGKIKKQHKKAESHREALRGMGADVPPYSN